MTRKALFLDRDGVINEEINYLHRIEDVVFVEGIFELVRRARAKGFLVIVVTNQAGIGRGYYTEDDFHILMSWMKREFTLADAEIDAVYFCPHHPTHGIGRYRKDCSCRKPKPGMLVKASADYQVDFSQSAMLGDKQSDLIAAERAGVAFRFLVAAENPAGSLQQIMCSEPFC